METIYLSLRAQVVDGTFFMKSLVPVYIGMDMYYVYSVH